MLSVKEGPEKVLLFLQQSYIHLFATHFDRKRTEIVQGLGFSLSWAFVTIKVKRVEEKLICSLVANSSLEIILSVC